MWAHDFRFYFTPLPGCFSTFPHGTGALSVFDEYLALEGGPPGFPSGSTCPMVLGILLGCLAVSRTGLSPSLVGRSRPFRYRLPSHIRVPQPLRPCGPRFRLFPVRSPLLGESRLISTPQDTEMFQFPWCRFRRLCIQRRISANDGGWVSPFGHLRINACLRLPGAYRSLPRPSSPVEA